MRIPSNLFGRLELLYLSFILKFSSVLTCLFCRVAENFPVFRTEPASDDMATQRSSVMKSLRSWPPVAGPIVTTVPPAPVAFDQGKRSADAEVAQEGEARKKARSNQRSGHPIPLLLRARLPWDLLLLLTRPPDIPTITRG